jgi:parallel beta-helix repeat protein
MTKKFVTLILALVLILTLTCSFSFVERDDAHAASSAIIVPDQYSTIQEAINNAVDGDTIFVKAGTYYEHVVVNKTVSLVGEGCSTTIVDGNGTGCVIYVLWDNVSITGFTIQRGEFGIYVLNAMYTEILGNTMAHNIGSGWGTGMRLDSAGYTLVHDNEITDNWRAIHLIASSPYVSIYRNNMTYNDFGIRVLGGGSNYLSVSGNYIANNRGYGVAVTGIGGESNYAVISGNVIVNNVDGVALGQGSSYNTVIQNNINGNEYGIGMQDSTQNSIRNNNIANNTYQVSMTSGSVNAWNGSYAVGGNYWSDYSGLDQFSGPYQNVTGSDGIGDTPYEIDAYNVDRYPLINPWTRFLGDVNDDGKVDIYDAILLSNAFNSEPGDPKWNPNADINGDNAVDIYDAIILANNFGKQRT